MTRTARREFPRKVKAAAIKRAAGHCERCKAVLKKGAADVDHILEDGLGGEPVLANAQVLCKPCHVEKTADRVREMRKADRQRDKSTGAVRPAGKLANRGFPKSQKPKPPSKPMPVRVRDVFGRTIRTAT
jgi:5-methylcytosine-specific restriction protein A